MLLGEGLKSAIAQLRAAGVPSPRMNAELLLMFTVGRDRAFLYGHPEQALSADERSRYTDALDRRASGVPAQYITGHQEFWRMDFIVSPAVLIPRPETEHVIETVLDRVGTGCVGRTFLSDNALSENLFLKVADVGTGSGCIALALAKELPHAQVDAIDISSDALDIARANAARLELESGIQFHQGDLLTGFAPNSFDFVVSNPPYVGESEEDSVQLDVRKFEPRNAVFAGPIGTEVIARLIPQAHQALKPGGWLVMEISGTIASRVRKLLADWDEVEITNDLQGIPRVVSARTA